MSRSALCLATLLGFAAAVSGQDYRLYFKKPEKPLEFWGAVKFEIEVGKFDLAKEQLQGFLKSNPTDEELLQIEEKDGMSAFLRLLTIKELKADAGPLLERVGEVVKKHRADPERIAKFIANLNASPEERVYALRELQKSGAAAVPHLIAALRAARNKPSEESAILRVLPRLYESAGPPMVAALEIDDPVLQAELIDVVRRRAETSAVPYLWFLSASEKVPEFVQKRATDALVYFLDAGKPERLPPARIALTREAERYYNHKVRFQDPNAVTVWRWDGNALVSEAMPASKAEEYYGLHWAREALEIDPTYEPAQNVFLSLALEKAYPADAVDQPLGQVAPQLREVLGSVNPDIVIKVLERALAERRVPVVLGAVRALGDASEIRAVRPSGPGQPVLFKALNYPDRRVQMAAADALLNIPGERPTLGTSRVVEVLRRNLAAQPMPVALIADFNKDRAEQTANAAREAGYNTIVALTGKEAIRRARAAADIDLVLVAADIPDPELPYVLGQLRSDIDTGLLPLVITLWPDKNGMVEPLRELKLNRLAETYRNTYVLSNPTPPGLKLELPGLATQAMGKPLTDAERGQFASQALLWLRRMAVGEIPHYDIQPAEGAILEALHSDELAPLAIEAAGRLPGREPQRQLARVVLDDQRKPEIRAAAADQLVRHIQQNSLVLLKEQALGLQTLFGTTEDARLKSTLARVVGSLRPSAKVTGERLQRYTPMAVPPAPAPAPAKGEGR